MIVPAAVQLCSGESSRLYYFSVDKYPFLYGRHTQQKIVPLCNRNCNFCIVRELSVLFRADRKFVHCILPNKLLCIYYLRTESQDCCLYKYLDPWKLRELQDLDIFNSSLMLKDIWRRWSWCFCNYGYSIPYHSIQRRTWKEYREIVLWRQLKESPLLFDFPVIQVDHRGSTWMASVPQWTWVWANSGRWFRTGKPAVRALQSRAWLNAWTTMSLGPGAPQRMK